MLSQGSSAKMVPRSADELTLGHGAALYGGYCLRDGGWDGMGVVVFCFNSPDPDSQTRYSVCYRPARQRSRRGQPRVMDDASPVVC